MKLLSMFLKPGSRTVALTERNSDHRHVLVHICKCRHFPPPKNDKPDLLIGPQAMREADVTIVERRGRLDIRGTYDAVDDDDDDNSNNNNPPARTNFSNGTKMKKPNRVCMNISGFKTPF